MQRFYAIVNPVAGRGAAVRAWEVVRGVLAQAGAEVEMVQTRGHGDAIALAEAAARAGWPAILALGGDGTVHEVANGILRASDGGAPAAAMGIVPVGSGNDFALLAGLARDPAEAARRITSRGERRVDVGRVDGTWFTNGVGVGLDARVAVEANRGRRGRGIGIYLWALARVLRSFRPPVMRVEIDGEVIERPLTLVTVGNGGRHGGGFWICPDARIDDGALDVCVCDGLSRMRILGFLPRTLRGTHVGASCVHMRLARRVRITSDTPLPVHADGEILYEDAREMEIEIVPGILRLLGG
ncbi:diacylglycerol kinase family protein [Longimicrobium sp.]|uniref:diacylglycerol/lipid kinase family protein n=1 Tax=Longimicrobium sp. TaxID=2029185 RepID=UPI002C62A985|nr:diacylglycerol kinase family protein [Longimicrobium sp.]HSU13898.1 diacylglycerol kinase family protein [Longimicrobium sp.]